MKGHSESPSAADSATFQCFIRDGKAETAGLLVISPEDISFIPSPVAPNASDPGVGTHVPRTETGTWPLALYTAHRQHPKLPMLQIRFKGSKSGTFQDVTFVFKQKMAASAATSGVAPSSQPRFDYLQQCVTALTSAFQRLQQSQQPVATTAPASAAPAELTTPSSTEADLLKSRSASTIATSPGSDAPQQRPSRPLQTRTKDTAVPEVTLQTAPATVPIAPPTPAVPQEPTEEEKRLLEYDADLKLAYQYLVGGRYLTREQFWKEHQSEVLSFKAQHPGLESDDNFLSQPPSIAVVPDSTAPEKFVVKTQYSPKDILQIRNEHPVINNLYQSLVTSGRMEASEFWARFFQSRYYFQMTGREPHPNADSVIFPEFNPNSLLPIPDSCHVQEITDPTVDLVASGGLVRPGFGTVLGEGALVGEMAAPRTGRRAAFRNDARHALIERLNRHALRLSKVTDANAVKSVSLPGNATRDSAATQQKSRIRHRSEVLKLATWMPDLSKPPVRKVVALYPEGVTIPGNPLMVRENCGTLERLSTTSRDSLLKRLKLLQCEPAQLPVPPSREKAKFMFLLNTKLIQRGLQAQDNRNCMPDKPVSCAAQPTLVLRALLTVYGYASLFVFLVAAVLAAEEVQALLARVAIHQKKLRELLRHFWASDIHQMEKQTSLATGIEDVLQELHSAMSHPVTLGKQFFFLNPRALYQPLIEAAKTALDRYQILRTRTQRRASSRRDLR